MSDLNLIQLTEILNPIIFLLLLILFLVIAFKFFRLGQKLLSMQIRHQTLLMQNQLSSPDLPQPTTELSSNEKDDFVLMENKYYPVTRISELYKVENVSHTSGQVIAYHVRCKIDNKLDNGFNVVNIKTFKVIEGKQAEAERDCNEYLRYFADKLNGKVSSNIRHYYPKAKSSRI